MLKPLRFTQNEKGTPAQCTAIIPLNHIDIERLAYAMLTIEELTCKCSWLKANGLILAPSDEYENSIYTSMEVGSYDVFLQATKLYNSSELHCVGSFNHEHSGTIFMFARPNGAKALSVWYTGIPKQLPGYIEDTLKRLWEKYQHLSGD